MNARYYQSLIGFLRWGILLGRGYLSIEFSDAASMMDFPRDCHLSNVFQMLSFLKSKHNFVTWFDSAEPEINQTQFSTEDWSATPYSPCKEDAPSNNHVQRGIGFTMRAFVESDHAGHSTSRHLKLFLLCSSKLLLSLFV